MVKSHSRGWETYYDGKDWRYTDNNEIDNGKRPCKKCGRLPNKDGSDACLGHIEGAKSACCGHGVHDKYVLYEE